MPRAAQFVDCVLLSSVQMEIAYFSRSEFHHQKRAALSIKNRKSNEKSFCVSITCLRDLRKGNLCDLRKANRTRL